MLGLLNDGDARGYLADEPFACPHLADSDARLARAPGPTCPITVVRS